MLGNDIVDLRDPETRPESFRARFDERVFSIEEQRAITHDAKPLARRWAHWAAKEAAYKLAKQVDSTFVFSPKRLVARYNECVDDLHSVRSSQSGDGGRERRGQLELPFTLSSGVRMLSLRSHETTDRVHVVAVPAGSDWGAVELAVEALDSTIANPSEAVRALAIREISRSLGVAADRLAIGREGRIPTVELDGAPTTLSLSLSHHGRWVGYAMRLRLDVRNEGVRAEAWTDSTRRLAGAV
jgi:hypothetical protein